MFLHTALPALVPSPAGQGPTVRAHASRDDGTDAAAASGEGGAARAQQAAGEPAQGAAAAAA